ncbi:DUF5666 domain-containing protein [Aeromonas sp. BIGb0445]|uniref:DUF5666 domain-containing protein n=1 Tax=Aeromonas sp. BIGb0445 TaxID=2940593 RepID=UPI0021697C54|nr:DUF5666 domain-containing protein [Aeromonas sp. BIGb0445]MCS3461349.1 hypothetical protein [Aeromonas sp. BIGb0445]
MKPWVAILLGLGLSACGGGGGDSGDSGDSQPTPPVQASSRVVSGAIEEVSGERILINGQWFSLSGAEVRYGQDLWTEPLQIGMDVEVVARGEQADSVSLNPLLTGQLVMDSATPVARGAAARAAAVWSVNGVVLDNIESSLSAGNWVMVFGDYDSQGRVVTREMSALDTAPVWIEVENRIQGLDSAAQTFMLGEIQVSYQGATIEDGPVQEGRWVEAFGRLEANMMQASELDLEDQDSLPDQSEIEGRVQYFDPLSGLLELDRQRQVRVTSQTRFEGGSSADLVVGVEVEVEVKQGSAGLMATEIEFDDDGQPAPTQGQQFKLSGLADWHEGQLAINGIPFEVDELTRFEDGLTRDNLDGRWVELDGIVSSGLNLVREIEPDSEDGELDLLGQVTGGKQWGYSAADGSLAPFEGQWAELECRFDGNLLSNCRRDD